MAKFLNHLLLSVAGFFLTFFVVVLLQARAMDMLQFEFAFFYNALFYIENIVKNHQRPTRKTEQKKHSSAEMYSRIDDGLQDIY